MGRPWGDRGLTSTGLCSFIVRNSNIPSRDTVPRAKGEGRLRGLWSGLGGTVFFRRQKLGHYVEGHESLVVSSCLVPRIPAGKREERSLRGR